MSKQQTTIQQCKKHQWIDETFRVYPLEQTYYARTGLHIDHEHFLQRICTKCGLRQYLGNCGAAPNTYIARRYRIYYQEDPKTLEEIPLPKNVYV